jgi:hypothetical protein
VHNFLAITFESVRFDIQNIDFSSKIALINKVMPLLFAFMGISDIRL